MLVCIEIKLHMVSHHVLWRRSTRPWLFDWSLAIAKGLLYLLYFARLKGTWELQNKARQLNSYLSGCHVSSVGPVTRRAEAGRQMKTRENAPSPSYDG